MSDSDDDDDDSGPAARTVSKDKRRDAPAIQKKIRLSCNMCPICWMPLAVDVAFPADQRWADVSVTFKGKPAFSIKHHAASRSVARHTFAFGVMGIAPGSRNYQACHYVDHCMIGNDDVEVRLWKFHVPGDDVGRLEPISDPAHMGGLGRFQRLIQSIFIDRDSVQNDIDGFKAGVCVERGVFADALGVGSEMMLMLKGMTLNHSGVLGVVDLVRSGTFVGCCDCNSSMTYLQETAALFRLAFFPSWQDHLIGKENTKLLKTIFSTIKVETMVRHLMLSGIIYRDSLVDTDGGPSFRVQDSTMRSTWQIRHVLVWCSLKILMGLWKYNGTDVKIRHHKSYIFIAVSDFYFSLMFYTLHEASKQPEGTKVLFETFNVFYASHLPFFLRSRQSNLSAVVLGLDSEPQFNVRFAPPSFNDTNAARTVIKRQLADILNQAAVFWTTTVQAVSAFADGRGEILPEISRFFVSPATLRSDRLEVLISRQTKLNVETYARILHHDWYWFHFKHITMTRIACLCKQYDVFVGAVSMQGNKLWRHWYRLFDASVRGLAAQGIGEEVRVLYANAQHARVR